MTAAPCTAPTTADQAVSPVHSTMGAPLMVDSFQEPGVHLVSLQAQMENGLVDLTPHAAVELALQLISNAVGDSGISEWQDLGSSKILSMEGAGSTSLDVVWQPLKSKGITVVSDLQEGPAQALEGLTPQQARVLAMMLLESSLTS
ncbi:hypothetical protein [Rhodococcus sp. ACT016]|uniref:hypothetical protein n=1 Tax=Rhodococcus sp. ACT016 TaxID=3134808 RepID=UPI003D2AC222